MPESVLVLVWNGEVQGAKTYTPTTDIANKVIELLEHGEVTRHVKVANPTASGLTVRAEAGLNAKTVGWLNNGEVRQVYDVATVSGNEWVRVGTGAWICRVLNGAEKAVWCE